jgi:hypothetical protein
VWVLRAGLPICRKNAGEMLGILVEMMVKCLAPSIADLLVIVEQIEVNRWQCG